MKQSMADLAKKVADRNKNKKVTCTSSASQWKVAISVFEPYPDYRSLIVSGGSKGGREGNFLKISEITCEKELFFSVETDLI